MISSELCLCGFKQVRQQVGWVDEQSPELQATRVCFHQLSASCRGQQSSTWLKAPSTICMRQQLSDDLIQETVALTVTLSSFIVPLFCLCVSVCECVT